MRKKEERSTFNRELADRYLGRIERGATPDDAARQEGTSLETIEEWTRRGLNEKEPYATFITEDVVASMVKLARKGNKRAQKMLKQLGIADP